MRNLHDHKEKEGWLLKLKISRGIICVILINLENLRSRVFKCIICEIDFKSRPCWSLVFDMCGHLGYLSPMLFVISFIFGAIVGSFLNVCIFRIPAGKSIAFPPSHCPKCQAPIMWYDNIPVISYLVLMGKCRKCRGPISARYPMVEFITALLSLAAFIKFGPSLNYFIYFAFISSLIVK